MKRRVDPQSLSTSLIYASKSHDLVSSDNGGPWATQLTPNFTPHVISPIGRHVAGKHLSNFQTGEVPLLRATLSLWIAPENWI